MSDPRTHGRSLDRVVSEIEALVEQALPSKGERPASVERIALYLDLRDRMFDAARAATEQARAEGATWAAIADGTGMKHRANAQQILGPGRDLRKMREGRKPKT